MSRHSGKWRLRDKIYSLRSFAGSISGVAAVEFSLGALPLIALLFAGLEIGLFHFYSSQLQLAAEIASRELMTGMLATDTTLQQFIDQKLCYAGGPLKNLLDCSQLRVDISSPATWATADVTNNYSGFRNDLRSIITPPQPGAIGIVRVGYPLPEFAGLIGGGQTGVVYHNGKRVRMIMGIAAFRVEKP